MSIRWGVLSTGNIAKLFAISFRHTSGGMLQAVASRSVERSEAFAKSFGVNKVYRDYRQLAEADDVDVVYIGTPHTYHYEHAAMCLQNGKHVLCEKPVTINTRQFDELTRLADQNNCFFMEAIWSRFLPAYHHVDHWLAHEMEGRAEYVRADFGMYKPFDPQSRLFDPHLGGGALLDIGFYPVWLAIHTFDAEPEKIHTEARFADTGVDEFATLTLSFPRDRKADLMCATQMASPTTAEIYGNGYRIEIDSQFHCPSRTSLHRGDQTMIMDSGFEPRGYQFETDEVNRCLQKGLKESPKLPLHRSRQIMRTLDRIREQIRLVYPEKWESV